MFVFALLGALLGAASAQNASTCADSPWSIFYVGKSGQFRFENEDTNAKVQIKIDSLAEYEGYTEESGLGSRTSNKLNSVAAQDFVWDSSTGESSTFGGVAAITNTFRSTLDIKGDAVPFAMTTVMFCADGTIDVYGESEDVGKDAIKFTVDIEDWPFLDSANVLGFGVTVKTNGDDGDETEYEEGEEGDTYSFGDGWEVVVPDKALADNTTLVDVGVVYGKGEGEGSDNSFVFVFPSFTDSIDYDPLARNSKKEGDDEDSASRSALAAAALAGAVALLRI